MSTFAVTQEVIATSTPHPNADRLDISTVEGMTFQFVTGRGQFKPGDPVIYFPVDAVLPTALIDKLGLTGKLAGKERNRIKTVRLRDAISQGVVCAPKTLFPSPCRLAGTLTDALGVTKYEPEPVPCHAGNLLPISQAGLELYDIEGADRYPEIAELLIDQKVVVTEKLEGSNFSVIVYADGREFVCQRGYHIEPIEGVEHSFWKVAREGGWLEAARTLLRRAGPDKLSVALRGEYLGPGVQGNLYARKVNDVRLFDIKVDGRYVDLEIYADMVLDADLPNVPILSKPNQTLRQWLDGRSIAEASDGPSALDPAVLREGIVIKPVVEQTLPGGERLILKQRGPKYLAKSDL